MKNIICELELEDLTITYKMTEIPETPQQIVFFLYGSQAGWPDWITQTVYSTGNVTTESSDIELDLRELFDGKVTKKPWFFHDNVSIEGRKLLATEKGSVLQFEESHGEESLLEQRLIKKLVQLSDDLVILASFISRRKAIWFQYHLLSENTIKEYIKSSLLFIQEETNSWDRLVKENIREFYKTAIIHINKFRSESHDLIRPIMDIVAGHEAVTLEQKFTLFFLALEKIKEIYLEKENISVNVKDKKLWKEIASGIKQIVHSKIDHKLTEDLIITKMNELNRPSIREVVKWLMRDYQVFYDDLYPNQTFTLPFTFPKTIKDPATFFTTRNKLIHTADEIDSAHLFKETYRLRSLVERLILKMLGWNDMSGAPEEGLRLFLTGEL